MALSIATFLFITLLSTRCSASDSCASSKGNSDLSIIHIYGKCSPFNPPKPSSSFLNTVINMASKDPQRLSYLSSLVVSKKPTIVPIAPGQNLFNIGNYVVKAKIGTPGQLMYMVLDTSNDDAWVPCSGCVGCTSNTLFAPTTSSTYGSVDCSVPECTQVRGLSCSTTGSGSGSSACFFNQSYGGDSSFYATLSRDSLGLANDVVPNYAFGCISAVSGNAIPPQGLLGLGRGSMSLLS
uniref:Aspartyl protease AED3-like n=2 Tax=Nicotiana TaxID=4085 RepID=A0A1S3YQV0_TOBAC|nr:PREDICTED: aspartyl protease AED3-like [Nicotiana tabacum]